MTCGFWCSRPCEIGQGAKHWLDGFLHTWTLHWRRFEDWLIHWNGLVDQLVTSTNANRSDEVWAQRQALRNAVPCWTTRMSQLRQCFLLVADQQQCGGEDAQAQIQCISSDDEEDDWLWISWEDHLPVNWQVQYQHGHFSLPGGFLAAIIGWICAAERLQGRIRDLSDLELVFLLALDAEFQFPLYQQGSIVLRAPNTLFQRSTAGHTFRSVQDAMKCNSGMFPHLHVRTPPAPAVRLGISMYIAGSRLPCLEPLWQEVQIISSVSPQPDR